MRVTARLRTHHISLILLHTVGGFGHNGTLMALCQQHEVKLNLMIKMKKPQAFGFLAFAFYNGSAPKICNALTGNGSSLTSSNHKLSISPILNRRSFATLGGLILLDPSSGANAASASAPELPPLPRTVDVGGGFDLLAEVRIKDKDVVYPKSMEGLWTCQRVVTQVDGDNYQAEAAWKILAATKLQINKPETFSTKYIRSPLIQDDYVVNDRGFEVASRAKASNVNWNVERPDFLEFDNKSQLSVVQRTVELPSDKGFGYNELYKIQDGPFTTRAVQVKRRYRRAFDGGGNRVVEGLEIVKTFRVLDGVAGTEFPTSTIKSQIRLLRPIQN